MPSVPPPPLDNRSRTETANIFLGCVSGTAIMFSCNSLAVRSVYIWSLGVIKVHINYVFLFLKIQNNCNTSNVNNTFLACNTSLLQSRSRSQWRQNYFVDLTEVFQHILCNCYLLWITFVLPRLNIYIVMGKQHIFSIFYILQYCITKVWCVVVIKKIELIFNLMLKYLNVTCSLFVANFKCLDTRVDWF